MPSTASSSARLVRSDALSRRPSGALALLSGSLAAALVTAPSAASPLAAQERTLGEPEAVHPADFALINTVRELSDGSVLVADPLGVVLVRLDPSLQRADTLGREGEGPQEYRQPDAVWPLPGDSTLLVDLGNARLTVVGPDGTFGRTRPITLGGFEPGRPLTTLIPAGTDGAGRLYFRGSPAGVMEGAALPDSAPVLRVAPGSDAVEEVARVRIQELVREASGPANDRQESITAVPLSPVDVWGVAPDGRLAVARSGPGVIEWITPDGAAIAGEALEVGRLPVRDAEKEAWMEERESRGGGIGVQVEVENGRARVSYGRMAGRGGADATRKASPWPETMPVFVDEPVRIDPRSRAWVRRSQPARAAPLYDVFDDAGARLFSLRMPPQRRLVGFGSGVVYAVRIDSFGLQRLERYPLPE